MGVNVCPIISQNTSLIHCNHIFRQIITSDFVHFTQCTPSNTQHQLIYQNTLKWHWNDIQGIAYPTVPFGITYEEMSDSVANLLIYAKSEK